MVATYPSLIFFFVKGTVVRKNFDIAKEAKGVGKGIIVDNKVTVDDGTSEIHPYWAGKGTTAVPDGGVYGPLISAITITPSLYIIKICVLYLYSYYLFNES